MPYKHDVGSSILPRPNHPGNIPGFFILFTLLLIFALPYYTLYFMRHEKDALGEMELPDNVYYGIHSLRAKNNFNLSPKKIDPEFINAYAKVKKAAATANFKCGGLDEKIFAAIEKACDEIVDGKLREHVIIDVYSGGAGTSLNMNMNEVIANRAIEFLGEKPGNYSVIHPINHVNMSQSTNDTYPTALKIAAIFLIRELHTRLELLQAALQRKENEFAHIIKMGRTQLQDAVPITLGMEFSAYAEAVSRDRWRLYKLEERLRLVNIGGTAIGTGLNSSKKYQFTVIETLRSITGIGLAKPENLVDITQNADVFVETSGLLKACAVTFSKIANDLRLLSSGPCCGFGEIHLPDKQVGSSIMPYKINPVIAEAVNQIAFTVIGNDVSITLACEAGQLELNAFLPLVADKLLESIRLLSNAANMFREHCIEGITANEEYCKNNVLNSYGIATILVPRIGYDGASETVKYAYENNVSVKEAVVALRYLSREEIETIYADIHHLLKAQQ